MPAPLDFTRARLRALRLCQICRGSAPSSLVCASCLSWDALIARLPAPRKRRQKGGRS